MWAVQMVTNLPEYHDAHHQKIASFINSENPDLAMQALTYFKPVHLQDTELQKQLADLIPDVSVQQKYEILWKLIALKEVNEETVLKLLHYFEDEKLGVGSLSLICRLITGEHLNNPEILKIVTVLSKHENNYIRNLSQKLLTQKSDLNQMN
jgi:hypothetical protein